jgi:serine/threonine protein kinase
MSAARESASGEFPDIPPPRHDADVLATGPDVAGAAEMPARLGRYRVTALLGRGGFGVVYKGYDDELRRDVAIKVPHRERLRTPADADVYLAEARVAAELDHPHIVPVFDLGRTADGLCFVVSKFIAGCNLAEKIGEARPSWVEAVELTATIAEALHHAHKHGLVHRDVKPSNILLDPAGKPFLADFGLALKEEDVGTGPAVCGTPAYMSPEQANGEGHRVDGRSDIFSLGVVFYELLTGRRPFRGEYPEILTRIGSAAAAPV